MQINDPAKALEAFVSFRPDVILLDVFMPELDGIDVLHEILLAGIPTRVILTTGGDEELLSVAREVVHIPPGRGPTYVAKAVPPRGTPCRPDPSRGLIAAPVSRSDRPVET